LLPTIKRQNLYEQIIDHLKSYILDNNLQPGDRLPTEAVLAEKLGVSRLSVREAFKVLESLGIVEIKTKDGTRLKSLTMKPVADHLRFLLDVDRTSIREMAVARQVLESALIPMIIESADASDFQAMETAIARMRELAQRGEAFPEADMQFHQALAAATKNRAMEGFGVMLQEFFLHLRGQILASPERQQQSLQDHEAIYKAIREKDVERAQQLMCDHLSVYDDFPFSRHSRSNSKKQ